MGIVEDLTAHNELHPEACYNTKACLESACVATSEGWLYADIDIGFHAHTNLSQPIQCSYVSACHTGLMQYQSYKTDPRYGKRTHPWVCNNQLEWCHQRISHLGAHTHGSYKPGSVRLQDIRGSPRVYNTLLGESGCLPSCNGAAIPH